MSKHKPSKPPERSSKQKSPVSAESVVAAFLACSRCSYFLTGYRLIHDDLEEAIAQSSGRWIDLTWNWSTGKLIQKSFGSKIDMALTHIQGICPDCRRAFVFDQPGGAETVTFRIQIKPR